MLVGTEKDVRTDTDVGTEIPVIVETEVGTEKPVNAGTDVGTEYPVNAWSDVGTEIPVPTEQLVGTDDPVDTEWPVETERGSAGFGCAVGVENTTPCGDEYTRTGAAMQSANDTDTGTMTRMAAAIEFIAKSFFIFN